MVDAKQTVETRRRKYQIRHVAKILRNICRQVHIANLIGFKTYLRYRFSRKGTVIPITIGTFDLNVRNGTKDLSSAISCLTGEFEILRNLLSADFDGVIVDAGSYIGAAALALNEMYPKSRIVCIEPSQKDIEVLRENVKGFENIEVIYAALVGTDAQTVSLKNRGTGEWGLTVVEKPLDNQIAETLHETPAVTLHSLGINIEDIGILKLDIEGAEYDLFRNDSMSLRKINIVFAELHDKIIDGCTAQFFRFSEDRILIKTNSEKYLSIQNGYGLK